MTRNQKKTLAMIIIAAVLAIAAYVVVKFVDLPEWAAIIIYIVPYLVVGYKVIIKAAKGIVRGQVFDENFLMTIATIGAFVLKEYAEAVAVMLFYQVGELFQSIAVGKSRKSIASLIKLRPDEGVVIIDGVEKTMPLEEVEVGSLMPVLAGQAIPLDGIIVEGATSADTSALTGESMPRDLSVGDVVLSGYINMSGAIIIKVTSPFTESTLSKILELVENCASDKAKPEQFITKFAKYYTPSVCFSAVLLAVIPSLILGASDWAVWQQWIHRALIFLVVSCPCALVISVPLTFFSGIGSASKKGILIKGSDSLEMLSKINEIVFDKTGTLTEGVFGVTKVFAIDNDEVELLTIAAHIESFSRHPIALSVVNEYKGEIDKSLVADVKESVGSGLVATYNGKQCAVGNAKLMNSCGVKYLAQEEAGTIIYVAVDGEYKGYIVISDLVKKDSADAARRLKELGVKHISMFTGDSQKAAQKIEAELGLDKTYAELLPQDKLEKLEEIKARDPKNKVAFVGDGINDAPVLVGADVGIAMGGKGADVAIEAADVVLMNDHPSDVCNSITIARRSMRIVYQNIFFALIVKFAVLLLSVFGIANMLLAIFADVGVCVIAILNAMRAGRGAVRLNTSKKHR